MIHKRNGVSRMHNLGVTVTPKHNRVVSCMNSTCETATRIIHVVPRY